MTVYVDDARIRAKVKGGPPNEALWSHLWADTLEELEEFAERLGLNPKWLQATSMYHYDLVESRRLQAIALGAEPVRAHSKLAVELHQKAREYKRSLEDKA